MEPNLVLDQEATMGVEINILGNYLFNPSVRHIVPIKLKHTDFLNNTNRELFVIIKNSINNNDQVDESIIRADINNGSYKNKKELLKRLGEIAVEWEYTDNIDSNIEYLTKASVIQKLTHFHRNESDFLQSDINIDELEGYLERKQTEYLDIVNSRVTSHLRPISEYVDEFETKLEHIKQNRGEITGIDSGFKSLNDMLNGFQPGELIIVAARPSIGKTALAINFAYNAAGAHPDKQVVIFSLEMSGDQLIQRLVSLATGINYRDFSDGKINNDENYTWNQSIQDLKNLNIVIDDNMGSTILDIQAGLRELKNNSNKEIGLVIVDYLQLINSHEKGSNRNQEVAKISRTLKMIAKELKVPVIAVAQLSRSIEQRSPEDRTPKLSDLRESGSIEQDADIVIFLDYDRTKKENDKLKENESYKFASKVVVDLMVAKNRNGETGVIKLLFDKKCGEYFDDNEQNRG